MDPLSIVLLILCAAVILWMAMRAFRNHHGANTVLRGGKETLQWSSDIGQLGGEHHLKRHPRPKR